MLCFFYMIFHLVSDISEESVVLIVWKSFSASLFSETAVSETAVSEKSVRNVDFSLEKV